jgi:hypothetical protein
MSGEGNLPRQWVPPEWEEFIHLDARWCRGEQDEKQSVLARIGEIRPSGEPPQLVLRYLSS